MSKGVGCNSGRRQAYRRVCVLHCSTDLVQAHASLFNLCGREVNGMYVLNLAVKPLVKVAATIVLVQRHCVSEE